MIAPRRAFNLASDPAAFDFEAYCGRIEYEGSRRAALDVLQAIHARHVEAIAFENLDPYLGRPVRLDTRSLQRKLVHERRGGYCYEQNLLLAHALHALGFSVSGLAARVMYEVPPGKVRPRTHMLLCVEVGDDAFLADVGFGGYTPARPLPLHAGSYPGAPLDTFRLREDGGEFVLESLIGGEFSPLYRFDLHVQHLADYELANWYVSHHPHSRFVTGLLAARYLPGRRLALNDNVFTTYHDNGRRERQQLRSGPALRAVLRDAFGIRAPEGADVDAALDRVAAVDSEQGDA